MHEQALPELDGAVVGAHDQSPGDGAKRLLAQGYQPEMVKEMGDKMKPEDKTALEAKLEALRKVKDSGVAADIKKAADDLTELAQKIGGEMYKNEQAAGGGEAKSDGKKDEPIEGEVVDKKE